MNNATDLIAKLLANEDITVVQSNVETASFNIKDRVLTLPIWKEASNDLIGMLVGHEVGHALYTSMEYMENEFTNTEYARAFQGYLNVLEDVRIEKLMKRKYPGIRKTFNAGYKELNDKDFFGMSSLDVDNLLLIDKINLHFKVGYAAGMEFTKAEQDFVQRAERTETIQDVIALAKEIFDYTKEDLEEKMEEAEANSQEPGNDPAEEFEDEEQGEESTSYGDGFQGADSLEEMLEAKTENTYQKRVGELADSKTRYVYYKPGKFAYNPLVTYKELVKRVNDRITRHRASYGPERYSVSPQKMQKVKDMKDGSKPVVSYLIKEFEMKKAATAYKRTIVSKTGQLDMRKIYAYTMKDDLFKRVSTVKNGKNHGMLFLLDWSGSMSNNIQQTIDQVINLAMFCRSAQIPFQVLAFSDNFSLAEQEALRDRNFKEEEGRLSVNHDRMALLEFFSHKQTSSEFNAAITMLKTIGPEVLPLNGTPLNSALNYMTDYVGQFKKQNNIEKLTFITLTDGQGETLGPVGGGPSRRDYGSGEGIREFLLDEVTGKSYNLNRYESEMYTRAFLQMIKERYDATTLGFYVTGTSYHYLSSALMAHYNRDELTNISLTVDRMRKEMKSRGYASLKGTGRDELFIVPAQAKIDNGNLDGVTAGSTASAIARQFSKTLNKRKTSRVLLSKFIDYVA